MKHYYLFGICLAFLLGLATSPIIPVASAQLTYNPVGPSVSTDSGGNTLIGNTGTITFFRTSKASPTSTQDGSCWFQVVASGGTRTMSLKCNDLGTVRTLSEITY